MENILSAIRANIQTVLVGEERAASLLLTALIAGGHVLIEDVPGMGKTVLARSLAKSVDAAFGRVQFTPDLLPSDVTGLNFFDRKAGDFVFSPGPVFCSILLADEINRATPRTQSALLECMAEGQVTVDGVTRRLEPPFFVIATQNPVETLGTYPLPEAQLDRFLLRISMDMPTKAQERQILERFQDSEPLESLAPVCSKEQIVELQAAARKVYIHPVLLDYMVDLAHASRQMRGGRAGGQPPGHPGPDAGLPGQGPGGGAPVRHAGGYQRGGGAGHRPPAGGQRHGGLFPGTERGGGLPALLRGPAHGGLVQVTWPRWGFSSCWRRCFSSSPFCMTGFGARAWR